MVNVIFQRDYEREVQCLTRGRDTSLIQHKAAQQNEKEPRIMIIICIMHIGPGRPFDRCFEDELLSCQPEPRYAAALALMHISTADW